jgi:hypothetical protein
MTSKFTVVEDAGDIQIVCADCGPFFEMPEPVDFDLMVRSADEHDLDEHDAAGEAS